MPLTRVRAGIRLTHACAIVALACLVMSPAFANAQEAGVWPGAAAMITGGGEQDVLLRTDPGFDAAAVTPLANGTPVQVLDGPLTAADGSSWYHVDVYGQVGYAPAGHLAASAEAAPVAEQAPVDAAAEAAWVPEDQAAAGWTGEQPVASSPETTYAAPVAYGPALTTSDVNLRAEPEGNAPVLATLPPGSAVEVTGDVIGGYAPVAANGTGGWIAAEYVQSAPAEQAAAQPVADPAVAAAPADTAPEAAYTAAAPVAGSLVTAVDANLRAEPYAEAPIIGSVPAGSGLEASGVPENGYTPVMYSGQFGWVADDLVTPGDGTTPLTAPGIDTSGAAPPAAGSLISWPFRGGTWQVIQGYNNGTHQNRSSFANYQYALDWARVDGNTAGQQVYAPASGTIRWIDRGSGGMLIDMGNGYGVAFFHVTIDYSLSKGQSVTAGQPVGTISGPGGEGYMSTEHIDLTLWQLAGGSHIATPFTGQFAIGGMEFPDRGGVNQHMGAQVSP